MGSAAIRSSWPLASVKQASTTRPLRFSISATELGPLARFLAIKPSFLIGRRKVRLIRALLAMEIRLPAPPAVGGSPEPSFGRKRFIDAQPSITVDEK
jgi:hypothetical protein